jgi:tricorn protease
MRILANVVSAAALAWALASGGAMAQGAPPHILQQPSISHDLIAFSYGGNIWTVPKAGGRATRLTIGVGVESGPIFSPDGATIAFTGEYDGNTDVFTVPTQGGIPHRVTYNPAPDFAVGWTPDGKSILFRSNRASTTARYTQLFSVPAAGGVAKRLPLPYGYTGQMSPDGAEIAYAPVAPAFGNNYFNYVAWGNYHGGMAGTVWITTLPGLDSVEVPHETSADFSAVWLGGKVYFLSGRKGPISVFGYDPATKAVSEVYHNTGPDIRSLATDGQSLIFDRLGELYTLTPGAEPQMVSVDVTGDMPDVRERIKSVSDEVVNIGVSPTGLRAVVEAHGEILTVPVKHGAIRDITNTPGVAEREPAWSPDGQSIAYFSDESGLYALHVASQTGAREQGPDAVKKYPLSKEPAYYFGPLWSPDSKKIAFYDNRLNTYVLDLVSGKLARIGDPDTYGGFSGSTHAMAWSPDSRWLVYPHSTPNHMHVLELYSTASGGSTQLTGDMADSLDPAFDRSGKYLYFLASNNAGPTEAGLDMTSDLYHPTQTIYALTLTAKTASPTAPELEDEKNAAEAKEKAKENADSTPAGEAGEEKKEAKANPDVLTAPKGVKATEVDLVGMSVAAIQGRIVAMPLPAKNYDSLQTGKPGVFYFIQAEDIPDQNATGDNGELNRYVLEDRKAEKLADHVDAYQITSDGEKMLLTLAGGHPGAKPSYVVAPANVPVKAGEGAVSLAELKVRVDPPAEWRQMYHEVWRIERAYFYDPNFHGVDTVAEEKALEPYVASIQARSDLNYVFQEMLSGFSVGHLRGSGGAIAEPDKVPGGLLGADYEIKGGHYCISKIYGGGSWSPDAKAPLAQPGLNVHEGDCILAVNGQPVSGDEDIQKPLEGTAGQVVTLTIGPAAGAGSRDISVVPVATEARLRNLDWIDNNRRLVDQMSGGKLAYVYLPDTAAGGFTAMNRYYFAQTNRQGVIVDERFNSGGQVADYIIEVLNRKIEGYWLARYGAIDRTPSAGIYGPKVMIANEWSGSGGDALPWLFKYNKIGPLVGKRTWGGLVGIGSIPVLMDGGNVTSPSVGFFSPKGTWDVENHGVDPDYPVEQDPKAVAAGHDPQLEAAVALAMDQLKTAPPEPAPPHPAYPNYHPAQ